MKQKVFLAVTIQPLTKHNFKRLGVGTKFKNWKLIYWNVLPLINLKVHKLFTRKGNRYLKKKNFHEIYSIFDLQKRFKELPKNFFYVNLSGRRILSSIIDRILWLRNGKKISFQSGNEIDLNIYSKKNLRTYIFKRNIFKILFRFFLMVVQKIIDIIVKIIESKPSFFFVFNYNIYLKLKKKIKKNFLIKADGAELELFLESKKNKNRLSKIIVFIDDMVEGSFDYKLGRGRVDDPRKKSENYWTPVKAFLDFVQTKFKDHKILIAASPRRNTQDIPIKGYKFIFDQTPNLIKNSKVVICHNSLACQIAVLYKKPIIFLASHYYESFLYYSYLNTVQLSKNLGTNLIYLRKNFKPNNSIVKKILNTKINLKKYEQYQKKYIQFPDLKPKGRWKKILQSLNNINN